MEASQTAAVAKSELERRILSRFLRRTPTETEIAALGTERLGLKKRPLTLAEVNAMSSDEVEWHRRHNGENFEKALAEPARKAEEEGRDIAKRWNPASESFEHDFLASHDTGLLALAQFPQLAPDEGTMSENVQKILARMKADSLDPMKPESYVQAFRALADEGALVLSPSAVGAGPEDVVTGLQLQLHPNFLRLCAPARRATADDKMSADEYKRAHPELRDQRIAPVLMEKARKVFDTFVAGHPEYIASPAARDKILAEMQASGAPLSLQAVEAAYRDLVARGDLQTDASAVVHGQVATFTDLGGHAPGYPEYPRDKYSWRMLTKNMSAKEFAERCQEDRRFKELADWFGA